MKSLYELAAKGIKLNSLAYNSKYNKECRTPIMSKEELDGIFSDISK